MSVGIELAWIASIPAAVSAISSAMSAIAAARSSGKAAERASQIWATAALDAGHKAWLRDKRFDAYTRRFPLFRDAGGAPYGALAALIGDDVDVAVFSEPIEEILRPDASADFAALIGLVMSDGQIILINDGSHAATRIASAAVDWLARATSDDRPGLQDALSAAISVSSAADGRLGPRGVLNQLLMPVCCPPTFSLAANADAAVGRRDDRRGIDRAAGGFAWRAQGWPLALGAASSWQRRESGGERCCRRADGYRQGNCRVTG